jgi:DNA-directed RNA polymerase specialized sigma24 family protein
LIKASGLSDRELRERLIVDPRAGWRMFIEQHTPALVAIIQNAGLRQHDETMDVYVRVCDHLAENDCARLRRHDPAKGRLDAWLTVIVRRTIVDWIRSRKGRKRLFASIKGLPAFDRRVFDLYYWRGRSPSEIVGLLSTTMADVFEALERIETALTDRQRAELMSMAARVKDPAQLETDTADSLDVERDVDARRTSDALEAALARLPPEDAAIVSLRYLDGLSRAQVERALHVRPLTVERMRGILGRLRELLIERGVEEKRAVR